MTSIKKYAAIFAIISLILLINSCGIEAPDAPNQRSSDALAGTIMTSSPTTAYYDSILAKEFTEATSGGFMLAGSDTSVIFLSFHGATVTQGYDKGQSYLVCSNSATIPKATYDGFQRAQILDAVKTYFEGSAIEFLTAEPTSGDYTTIHLGGTYQDLGCRTGELLQGAAPFDIGNVNLSDTGFVFSKSISNIENVVAITLEVVKNTLGLQNGEKAVATMPTISSDNLTGTEEIHSMARLLWKVDPATIIDITPMQHELDVLVPGDIKLDGFDRIITATLGAAQSSAESDTSGASGGLGDLFNGVTSIFTEVDPNTVSAVATMAGHPEIAIAAQVLLPVVQNQASPNGQPADPTSPNQSLVPDYATMLGLRSISSMNELIANFWAHMEIIKADYSGDDLKALRSLLIVSYSQVYRTNLSLGK